MRYLISKRSFSLSEFLDFADLDSQVENYALKLWQGYLTEDSDGSLIEQLPILSYPFDGSKVLTIVSKDGAYMFRYNGKDVRIIGNFSDEILGKEEWVPE